MESSFAGGGAAQAVRIEGAVFPGGPFPRPAWFSGPPGRDGQWRGGLPAAGRGRALPRAPARGLGVMLPESRSERMGPSFPELVTVSGQGRGYLHQSKGAVGEESQWPAPCQALPCRLWVASVATHLFIQATVTSIDQEWDTKKMRTQPLLA